MTRFGKTVSYGVVALLLILLGTIYYNYHIKKSGAGEVTQKEVTNFTECMNAGFPVMESYPRQCMDGNGNHFTEDIATEVGDMSDKIVVDTPKNNMEVKSPVTITGKARGTWYFEASFPITIVDWDGKIIGEGHAEAQGDWMTTDFVPFKASITYVNATSSYSNKGAIILKNDNPSGDPERDMSIEIPVVLK